MAKIFKTISLEERWKASVYNQGPIKPASVEQGSITLKDRVPVKDVIIPLLKAMPDPVQKNSNLLKLSLSKAPQPIETLKPLITKPLSAYARPLANTKFRSAISLADRLKQPNIGSTTHLAQYFLADQYTDYIKITPFGIFNHTSDIVLHPITFTPNQGGNNPTIFTFDSLLNQGTVFSNGVYSSLINIQTPLYDSLLLQGVILSNGAYQSLINVTIPPATGTLTTDPQTSLANVPSIQSIEFKQGIILDSLGNLISLIDPATAASTQTIELAQGLITDSQNNLVSVITTSTPNVVSQLIPANIIITNAVATPQQGGIDPTPISFEPVRTSPVLNVLFYESQRALAFFAPRVIHGSSNLSSNETKPGYFQTNNTFFAQSEKVAYASQILRVDYKQIVNSVEVRGVKYDIEYFKSLKDGWGNDQKGTLGTTGEIVTALGQSDDGGSTELTKLAGLVDKVFDKNIPNSDGKSKVVPVGGKPDINSYITLAYSQIKARDTQKAKGTILKDFRSELTGLKGGNGEAVVVLTDAKTVDVRGLAKNDRTYKDDFIPLQVKSLRDGKTTYFRAFITSFSDSVSPTWNDINYVGRQDTLKAFKGSTRSASIGFKVAALRKEDMEHNYFKLNELIQRAGVGSAGAGDLYIKGPLCSITVGKWFKNTPVIFNSIKYDIQPAEYSWEIDSEIQMPHLVDVSLDFVVLGDTDGSPLNASSNTYFNYTGK